MQMFFDGHYPTLPDYWIFSGAEPRHIPSYSAVYIIIGVDHIVKYVGQTTNMKQRYGDHCRWMKPKDRIGWIRCELQELLFMEAWFIATLRPYMNANQNKRATKALAKKSARLDVSAEVVWKRGRAAEVNDTTRLGECRWSGVIEEVSKLTVKVSGQWKARSKVTITLA